MPETALDKVPVWLPAAEALRQVLAPLSSTEWKQCIEHIRNRLLKSTPVERPHFTMDEMTTAARRVDEVTLKHPTWPQARIRSTVARELAISTVQLRYLLRKVTSTQAP